MKEFEAVLNAIMNGTLEIKAKSEAEAQSKINKVFGKPKCFGYRVVRTNGNPKYELRQIFNGYVQENSYTEFNLINKGNGFYGITYKGED